MRRTRVFAWALVGCSISALACTSSPAPESPPVKARLGRQRQALGGNTNKVCQLTGDVEWEMGGTTKSLTDSRFGVYGTDLGYPIYDTTREKVWFLFGDEFPSRNEFDGTHVGPDPLASTSVTLPSDGCPVLDFASPGTGQFTRLRLTDDRSLNGFEVPTGGVYDDSQDRLIAGFMRGGGTEGLLAEASVAGDPTAFTPIVDAQYGGDILSDIDHFLLMAPVFTTSDKVARADQLPSRPGGSNKVLLVYGTGAPYRQSAVYLAAVHLDLLYSRDAWRFMDGTSTMWSPSVAAAKPLFSEQPPDVAPGETPPPNRTGCAGEISVSYNAPFKQWMMTYHCLREWSAGLGPLGNGMVILRTAKNPEGPWSSAIPLFVPQKDGAPADGDAAYGAFVHRGNLRLHDDGNGALVRMYYTPDNYDPEDTHNDPTPLPTTCATTFPSYCPPPEDSDRYGINGCCTQSDRCCDAMFDRIDLDTVNHHETMSSSRDGAIYAPYIIEPWSTPIDSTSQNLTYVVSTWNPYTVVLMQTQLVDNDLDNDGVEDASDNCPGVTNPGQQNCNRAAEDAWNDRNPNDPVPILGDACDPVPCPTAIADRVVETHFTTGSCTATSWTPSLCAGREIRNRIDVSPVGASATPAIVQASTTRTPLNVTIPGVDTYTRFCQNNKDLNYWCWDPAKLGEDQLFDHYASADAERLDPLAIWHRVQLHRSCAPNQLDCIDGADGDPVARDGFFTMDYGPARRRYIWEYTDDNTFWLATSSHAPTIPANPNSACEPANDNLYGAGTCLDGRLWTHGVTPVGNTCDRAPPDESCGLINAPPGATVGFHGEQLANHFFDSAPDAPWYHTNGGMQARPIFFIRMTLPDPWPVWRFASGTAVPLVNEDGQLNAFFESGRREDVDGVVSHDARIALYDTTLNWLSAVEASPSAGNPWRPVGIALKSGVGDIEAYQSLVDDGAGTIDLGGAPQIVSGPDGAPRPRTGYGAAYSRSRGRIFVVGGLDVETGEPYQDVWKLDFDVGYWQLVPRAPQVLTTILAVTYSYRDGMLWIVDRDERDPSAAATRLVRLDPTTGSSEVLHITQPGSDHAYDELTLGVDLDGNVILTASKNYPQRHRIAVISPRAGGYDVAMTRCRQRALVTPALADLHGYALFYQQDNLPDTRTPRASTSRRPLEKCLASASTRFRFGLLLSTIWRTSSTDAPAPASRRGPRARRRAIRGLRRRRRRRHIG